MEWQPIETAPKDGTRVLVWSPQMGCSYVASWAVSEPFGHEPTWSTDSEGPGYSSEIPDCTHWMPLPKPPVAAQLEPFTAKEKGVIAGDGQPCLNDHDPYCGWPNCLCRARHDSDCAVHNEPAYPAGPCDCSLRKLAVRTIAAQPEREDR